MFSTGAKTTMTNLAEELSSSLAAVVEAAAPSVIRVDGHRRL